MDKKVENIGAIIALIPTYDGEPPQEVANLTLFLSICEQVCTSAETMALLPIIGRSKLKGKAYEFLSMSTELQTCNWDRMKEMLKERFAKPPNYKVAMFELTIAKQNANEPVMDYYNRVVQIGKQLYEPDKKDHNNAIDHMIQASFEKGLEYKIRIFVQAKEPANLTASLDAARTGEMNIGVDKLINPRVGKGVVNAMFKAGANQYAPRGKGKLFDPKEPCKNCGKMGHSTRDKRCCFKCKGEGHMSFSCPKNG